VRRIRPDGYGRYAHPGGVCDFYLEYDRGTETTRQLANKLAGYVGVARDWTEEGASSFPNLLFVVPNAAREQTVVTALERALARFKQSRKLDALPFFVTSERHLAESGVLGPIWRPLDHPSSARRLFDRRASVTDRLAVRVIGLPRAQLEGRRRATHRAALSQGAGAALSHGDAA
jgi:hypothetical protein